MTEFKLHSFMSHYYQALDAGRIENVTQCFHPEGVWHRKGEALAGHDAIRTALSKRDTERQTAHIISNFYALQNDDGNWQARYYLMVYDKRAGQDMRLVTLLNCFDNFRQTEDGPRIIDKKSRRHFKTS